VKSIFCSNRFWCACTLSLSHASALEHEHVDARAHTCPTVNHESARASGVEHQGVCGLTRRLGAERMFHDA